MILFEPVLIIVINEYVNELENEVNEVSSYIVSYNVWQSLNQQIQADMILLEEIQGADYNYSNNRMQKLDVHLKQSLTKTLTQFYRIYNGNWPDTKLMKGWSEANSSQLIRLNNDIARQYNEQLGLDPENYFLFPKSIAKLYVKLDLYKKMRYGIILVFLIPKILLLYYLGFEKTIN